MRKGRRPFVKRDGVNFSQIANPALVSRSFPGETVPRTPLFDKQDRLRSKRGGGVLTGNS